MRGPRVLPEPLPGIAVEVRDLIALRAVQMPRRAGRNARTVAVAGNRMTRLRGRGIDFSEVRLYEVGDDVRSIDWRVTARKAKVHTKVYREERERPTLILVDLRQSMLFGSRTRTKSVAAAEAAALLAWHSLDGGDRVGGLVLDEDREVLIKPRRDPRTVARLLGRVADASQRLVARRITGGDHEPGSPGQGLRRALDHLQRVAGTGFRIYLITDFTGFDAALGARLLRLARHNTVVAIRVMDPLEAELPPPDQYVVSDGRIRFDIDSADAATRTAYRRRYDDRCEFLGDACRKARTQLLTISTTESAAVRLTGRWAG